MKSEAQLERLFTQLVTAAGGIPVKLAPTHVGLPDRLVIWPGGRIALAELKTETGRLSPAQTVWHDRAADLGCEVAVLHGEDEIRQWVFGR
jgi:hypothetical protein